MRTTTGFHSEYWMSIPLSDDQLIALERTAAALVPDDRAAFYTAVARALADCAVLGDGVVQRAIAIAFHAYWRPPPTAEHPTRHNVG
jgi:hypothetical protein